MAKNKTKIIILAIVLFVGLASAASAADDGMLQIKNPTDNLSVKIPGLRFSDPNLCGSDNKSLCVNWIGEYIAGIYNYAVGIVGIVATIVMMFGGVLWLTAGGNAGKISEAKAWIGASFTGLLIALASFMILNEVNPELITVGQKSMQIKLVEKIPDSTPVFTSGGGTGGGTGNVSQAMIDNFKNNGFDAALKAASSKYGINCSLAKAIIFAESSGNQSAVSPVGAQGLMQIMPSTARGLGCNNCNLLNGATSIEYGSRYIKELSSTACNGSRSSAVCNASNPFFIAAAYNGGPRANKMNDSPSAPTCNGSPNWQCAQYSGYQETRDYVRKVMQNYEAIANTPGWGC